MKFKFLLITIAMLGFFSIAHSQELSTLPMYEGKKVLIAYFSHYNSTHQIATQIQSAVGGDIFRIEPAKPYPSDYDATVAQARRERGVSLPELKSKIANISSYDIIFIGTPVWGSTISPPVIQFLSEYNLADKTIIPFCTYKLGAGNTFSAIQSMQPQANVLNGISVWESNVPNARNDVYEWLKLLK